MPLQGVQTHHASCKNGSLVVWVSSFENSGGLEDWELHASALLHGRTTLEKRILELTSRLLMDIEKDSEVAITFYKVSEILLGLLLVYGTEK